MKEGLIKLSCGCMTTREAWVKCCPAHEAEAQEHRAAAHEHRSVRPKSEWNKPTDNFEDLI